MKIVFMGTPAFAVPVLEALVEADHEIAAVYTQPPRPGGRRGRELVPSAVQVRAEASGIPVRSPVSLRAAEAQAELAALGAEVGVVAAYGLILPQAVLDMPRLGCLNVHASLLPRWRGAAPIQRAILAGDTETGVAIMQMAAGLDTGPVRREGRTAIGDDDTAGTLTHRLAYLGAELITQVLANFDAYPARPQAEAGILYARKIEKSEAKIDWSVGALQVTRRIRALNPAPSAWFEYGGERIKIHKANILTTQTAPHTPDFLAKAGLVIGDQLAIGCGDGAIRPDMVQRAGRGVMTVQELLRGFPIPAGTQL